MTNIRKSLARKEREKKEKRKNKKLDKSSDMNEDNANVSEDEEQLFDPRKVLCSFPSN
jgi:hypothetical protein